MAIFLGQGDTKSCYLKFLKSQYLAEFLRLGPNFFHVIIIFMGFKITFCNKGSNKAPLLISRGLRLAPPQGFVAISDPRSERVNAPLTFYMFYLLINPTSDLFFDEYQIFILIELKKLQILLNGCTNKDWIT